nr:hypothetical protein [Oenococcus oeni]
MLSGVSGSGKTTFINKIVDEYQQTAARVFQNPDQQFTMETPLLELVFLLENLRFPSQKNWTKNRRNFKGISFIR